MEYKAIKKGFFMKKHFIIMAVLLTNVLSMQAIMTVAGRAVALKRVSRNIQIRSCQTGVKPEKRYNIYDIVRKGDEMEAEHGSKAFFLRDVPILNFGGPSEAMAYFKLVDSQLTQGKANCTSPEQFIQDSKQQEKE